jgi:hypothetical protein
MLLFFYVSCISWRQKVHSLKKENTWATALGLGLRGEL